MEKLDGCFFADEFTFFECVKLELGWNSFLENDDFGFLTHSYNLLKHIFLLLFIRISYKK